MRTAKTNSASKPNKPKPEHTPNKVGKAFATAGRVLAGSFLVLVISGCIVLSVLTVYVLNLINTESEYDLRRLELNYTTIIYAMDENDEPYELQRLHSEENRIWVDIEQMPKALQDAAVAGEDKRFYEHHGVDWIRTVKAFLTFMDPTASGVQGGSTITQQLIKNISGEDKVSIDRKVKEIFRAIKMSNSYTKEEVLEAYLNTIHLGNNTNGVQAAANLYFDKDVSELDIAESAALIAITQNPVKNDLFRNPDNNKVRQTYILGEMLSQGKITQKEYDEAVAEELNIATQKAEQEAQDVQSWFVDNLMDEVMDDLVEKKGYERSYAYKQLTTGGLRIYSTVDQEMQDYLEEKYEDDSTFPTVSKLTKNGKLTKEQPESAMVIMDLEGNVKAMVGGRGEKEGARLYNRAVNPRSPGSSIKPIATYGQAIDMNMITFSSLITDQKININGWSPNNHYSGFLGPITVDEAIQLLQHCGGTGDAEAHAPGMLRFSHHKLGFTTLTEPDIGPSPMAIGSMTNGVTVLEMTAAYQMFGNGGLYYEPRSIPKILDSDGNIILKEQRPGSGAGSDTATVMNQLLQNVVKGRYGTVRAPAWAECRLPETGTTDNDYDQWFVGPYPILCGRRMDGLRSKCNDQIQPVSAANRLEECDVRHPRGSQGEEFPMTTVWCARITVWNPAIWPPISVKRQPPAIIGRAIFRPPVRNVTGVPMRKRRHR
ncbi:MAG: transglycosylase domain-containing protein [Oscillospiraceae bacterium]